MSAPAALGSRRQFLLVWAAVTGVIVLAHFAFFRHMGLYEDDHWMIGVPMCEWQTRHDLLTAEKSVFTDFPQGRPLHCGFGFLLAYTSTHAGGLPGAFAAAAAIWALNAGLCLALFWRQYGPTVATVAALVFVLLPSDTTHPMLHAVFAVHPSVTFLLLSGLAYSRGRPLLALFPAMLSMLTYETCFLPALAWPILFPHPTRSLWRRCLTHGLLMGIVLAFVFFVRAQVGENRAAEAMKDKRAVIRQVWKMSTKGPIAAGKAFASRPVKTARTWMADGAFARPGPSRRTAGAMALGAGALCLFALLVARRRFGTAPVPVGAPSTAPDPAAAVPPAPPPESTGEPKAPVPQPDRVAWGAVVRLIGAGVLMVVLGYAAALTREPGIEGRNSSVNIASALGWGVLFSGLVVGLGRVLTCARLGAVLVPALAAYLCLLAGFHVLVQREYARSWAAQGEFWKDVMAECPDVEPNTLILYPLVGQASPLVRDQEWADYMVFRHVFAYPPGFTAPQAFGVGAGAKTPVGERYESYAWHEIERDGDKLFWKHWDGSRHLLEQKNVILLRHAPSGRFERMTGTIRVAGTELVLKPRGEPTFTYLPHKLFWSMFPKGLQPEAQRRVPRL